MEQIFYEWLAIMNHRPLAWIGLPAIKIWHVMVLAILWELGKEERGQK